MSFDRPKNDRFFNHDQEIGAGKWHWHMAACSCCGKELFGCRMLATRRPHAHHPLKYCIVGMLVSVN